MPRLIALALLLALTACAGRPGGGPAELLPVTTADSEARTLYFSGREKAERFHHAAALADFRAAVAQDPNFATAWLEMSFVSEGRKASEEALVRAAALLDHASPGERLRIRAVEAEGRGDVESARELFRELVTMYPGDARTHYYLGNSFMMTDDSTGIVHMEQATDIDPTLDVAWNMLGYSYSYLDRMADAIRAHGRYVELLPNEPNAHDSYAETLLKAGRFEESIAEYDRAIALDPSFVWSRLGIGHNLVFLGRFDEARGAYQQALAASKTPLDRFRSADWLVVRAVYAGQTGEALRAAQRTVELASALGAIEVATATRNLARIQMLAGRYEVAEKTARAAVDSLPADTSARHRHEIDHSVLRLRTELAAELGEPTLARERLHALKRMAGADSPPWEEQLNHFVHGYLLVWEGRPTEAVATLMKASPNDPRVTYWLARSHEAAGNRTKAHALYRKVANWNSASLGHAIVFADAKKRLATFEK